MSFVIKFLAAFLLETCLLLLFCYPENICDIVFSLELQFSVKVLTEDKPKCKQLTTEVFLGLTAVIPLIVTLRMLVSRLLSPAGPASQLGMADMWNMALFLFYLSLVCKGYWCLHHPSSPVIQQRRQVAWVSDWKSLFCEHGCPISRSFPGYHRQGHLSPRHKGWEWRNMSVQVNNSLLKVLTLYYLLTLY